MRSGRIVGTVERDAVVPDDVVKMITGSSSI